MLSSKPRSNCPGCGPNYVNHTMHWTTSVVEFTLAPFLGWSNVLWRKVMVPIKFWFRLDKAHLLLVKMAVKLKIGTFISSYQEETDTRARSFWEEAERRGITMAKFSLLGRKGGDGPYLAEVKGKTLKFNILPRLTESAALDWIDDKATMRKEFQSAGFPIARGGVVFSEKEALKLFNDIGGTVIVKPRTGSRSRHTTVSITSKEELLRAFRSAKQLSPWVIIEEQLRGFVFRATVIDGKVAAVMRREPPYVIGDGIKNIIQLVEEENKFPGRQGPVFHPLVIDSEALAELNRQKLSPESIPQSGQLVILGQKVGRNSGGSTTDVTDEVHPDNNVLFEKIASFLQDPLVGIDIIIEDMSKPWHEQMPAGVIECNSLPFIDLHHYPLRGKVRNVAGILWDYVERRY